MNTMKSYNYQLYGSAKAQLEFEIRSFIGRTFKKRKSKIPLGESPLLLDLGVGSNYTNGWIHADFFILRYRFWSKSKERMPEVELDLRYPINCPPNVADGIYTSHTLEHLFPDDAINLLKEIYRILKPGCYLRIVVPDIEIAVNFYVGKNKDLDFETGCEAISSYTQNWGHKSAWDMIFLTKILTEIGFTNIRKVEFGKDGLDKRLIKEPSGRKQESLVLEAQKV